MGSDAEYSDYEEDAESDVGLEPEKDLEWGLEQLKLKVKRYYRLAYYEVMMDKYKQMLTSIRSGNHSGRCIESIVDMVSKSANESLRIEFYETTLNGLEKAKNEGLWFKTGLKLCKLWFDRGEYGRMTEVLKELHKSCISEDGTDDRKKRRQLLEVYAIEIQMYSETKNKEKLKQVYPKALAIKSAIRHPRIIGIIRECGGKMHMLAHQWEEAGKDFFEAFKNYDKANKKRGIQCLKYLVLANMLMDSEVNPFDGQEAKPYKNDPQILANLIAAYQQNEILKFEKILKSTRRAIMDDPFSQNAIEDLLKNVRTQDLNVREKYVEHLLDSLIDGHIDQVSFVNNSAEGLSKDKSASEIKSNNEWEKMTKVVGDDWMICARTDPEVKKLIREGIPPELRNLLWQMIPGGFDLLMTNARVYEPLSHKLSPFKSNITVDLHRTLTSQGLFREKEEQLSLFKVLNAYSIYDREIGYVQGMGYIVGVLLQNMDEEEAFWVLVALMKEADAPMRGLFMDEMPLLHQYLFQLERLIERHMPQLGEHFHELGIVPLNYAVDWFVTVFSKSFPLPLLLRIWDVFLTEGVEIVFKIGLALLKYSQEDLLRLPFEKTVKALTNFSEQLMDPDILLPLAYTVKVSSTELLELKYDFDNMKKSELEERKQLEEMKQQSEAVSGWTIW